MKEPHLCRQKKPLPAQKIKLMCSFNGSFRPFPPSNKLRYIGGETRILSFDRNISFSKFLLKISELCPKFPYISIKYQVPIRNPDGESALVAVYTDDDVRCMIEEHDKIEAKAKPSRRVRVFVCGYNGNSNSNSLGFSYVWNVDNRVLLKRNVKTHGIQTAHVGKIQHSIELLRGCALNTTNMARTRSSRDEFVALNTLGLQTLTTGFAVDSGDLYNDDVRRNWNFGSSSRVFRHCGKILGPGTNMSRKDLVSGDRINLTGLDRSFRMARYQNQAYNHTLVSNSTEYDLKRGERNDEHVYLENLSRENVMSLNISHNSAKNSFASVLGSNRMNTKIPSSNFLVRNDELYIDLLHRVRNPKISSYDIHKYRVNPHDVMDHRISRFDGNPSLGKCYAKLRPRSNILKFGQVRSPHAHFGKPSHEHSRERAGKNVGCSKGTPTLFNFENSRRMSREQIVQPRDDFLGKEFGNPIPYSRKITAGKDLLPDLDLKCPPHNPKIEPDRVHMDLEASAKESTNDCDTFDDLSCVVNPSVDLSVHNIFSPSSMRCSSLSNSGPLGSDGRLRMHDVNNISVHDSTFSRHGMSTQLTQSDFTRGKENKKIAVRSNLTMEEKASTVKGSGSCSKVVSGISSQLAAFYTQLDSRELQTIKNSDLEEIRELASGTYGTVFHGKWRGSDVAIKRIKASCFGGGELGENRLISDFWKEARILGQLHHPNVMAFYGVVTDGPANSLAAVMEFMVNGSLKQVLQRKDRTIDRRKRIIIAMDAAFGMEYLHEKYIVHFDLKSHNLLVNMKDPHRPVCKIGDLGLSKVKLKKLVSAGVQGTIPWMAPELFSDKRNMVSEKVDVYSFGIVMWELLTGEDPYANMCSEEIIAGKIKGDLRPEVPRWCDPLWRSLMERCWSSNPNSRPAFSEIAKELRAMAASMNIK